MQDGQERHRRLWLVTRPFCIGAGTAKRNTQRTGTQPSKQGSLSDFKVRADACQHVDLSRPPDDGGMVCQINEHVKIKLKV